jgi:Chaperone of endosialidase
MKVKTEKIGMKPQNLILILILIGCFGLLPKAQAVNPPPDGGYPNFNTAEGTNSLFNLTTGVANTGVGWYSLWSNTDGSFNTATGAGALLFNTDENNTAFGAAALLFNTTGGGNTATGAGALLSNTIGFLNTAHGAFALSSNTEGVFNTATGNVALLNNTTGGSNTAIGGAALQLNTTGSLNTATGADALQNNISGIGNTAIGVNALVSNTTGSNNVALGVGAGSNATTGNNNVYIGQGMVGVADESDACYIRSIFNQLSSGGTAVFVNADNKLGTATSSRRFKDEIQPMDDASEVILALKPVSFRYKKEVDPKRIAQFGLVAEEVEALNPDLVVRDKEGKPYSVRYDQVNAMLLNEFLKEHKKVEEQQATIAQLKSVLEQQERRFAQQERQIAALAAGLQKVCGRIEVTGSAPQVAKIER